MGQLRSWRAASQELAEVVRVAGPRIVLVGAVACALVGVPILVKFWAFFPG